MNIARANFAALLRLSAPAPVATLSCGAALGLALAVHPLLGLALLVIAVVGWTVLRSPDAAFLILLVWVSASGFFMNETILGRIGVLEYVDELLIVVIALHVAVRALGLNRSLSMPPVVAVAAAFALVAVVSTFCNGSSRIGLINYLTTYMKVFVVLTGGIVLLERERLRRLILCLIAALAVHAVFAGIQYATYSSTRLFVGHEINLQQDAAAGLMGEFGAHRLGHFSLMLFMLATSVWLFVRRTVWGAAACLSLSVFVLAFAELDYLYLFLFVAAGFILLRRNIPFPLRIAIPALVIAVAAVVLTQPEQKKRYVQYFGNMRTLTGIGKVRALLLTKDILLEHPHQLVVGVGPSSFAGGIAAKAEGKYYERYVGFRVTKIKSTLDFWWSSFIGILSETGLLGFSLYTTNFVIVFRRGWNIVISTDPDIPPFDRGVAFALCHITIFMAYICMLSNAFEWTVVTIPYALTAAYVWLSYDKFVLRRDGRNETTAMAGA